MIFQNNSQAERIMEALEIWKEETEKFEMVNLHIVK